MPIAACAAAVVGLGSLFALNGCGKGGGSSSGGSTLAVVNGEDISLDDFHQYLEYKPNVRVVANNGGVAQADVAEPLALQALQDMILRQITLQVAKDEGVYPTEQEITKELDFKRKLDPDYLTKLQQAGWTIDRAKQDILISLAREKLLTKNVTVTMAEAEDFIKANPKMFTDPAKADMLWVFAKSPARKGEIDAALKAGQTFSVVATQYSEAPGARENGGRFPRNVINTFQPVKLQEMVNKAKEGEATDWLPLTDGFAKFFVEKKTPEKPVDMNSYRKEFVRRSLAQQRGQQAIDLGKRVSEKLAKSKIDVKDKMLSQSWAKAFERFKEEQKVDVAPPTSETKAPGTP